MKPLKVVNGINALSLDDIYMRKIWAITGVVETRDASGRNITVGGRQERKNGKKGYGAHTKPVGQDPEHIAAEDI